MKRAIAWLLCLLLLCSCGAAPAETPAEAPAESESALSEPAAEAGDAEPESDPEDEAPAVEEPPEDEPSSEAGETPDAEPSGEDAEPAASPTEETPQTAKPSTPAAPAQPSAPAETPSQEPEPAAPAEPPTPPASAEPGIWETADGLYYIQEDGTCMVNGTVGHLTFGADGRYTSGSADLDAGIDNLIAQVCPDLTASSESRLRLLYNYIRDNYRYLSMEHYEAGSTYWGNSAALTMLNQGKGNCYNFTALFTACARRLGYQAYNVAGHEWSATNDHAWTMINWPDGVTYLFDVQLEWAYLYQYANKPKIDMFKASGGNGSYNGFAYYFP